MYIWKFTDALDRALCRDSRRIGSGSDGKFLRQQCRPGAGLISSRISTRVKARRGASASPKQLRIASDGDLFAFIGNVKYWWHVADNRDLYPRLVRETAVTAINQGGGPPQFSCIGKNFRLPHRRAEACISSVRTGSKWIG